MRQADVHAAGRGSAFDQDIGLRPDRMSGRAGRDPIRAGRQPLDLVITLAVRLRSVRRLTTLPSCAHAGVGDRRIAGVEHAPGHGAARGQREHVGGIAAIAHVQDLRSW